MPSSEAQEDYTIPSWIKNNAGWWAEDQIDDSSFLQAIEYLIENGIIVVPITESGTESSSGVPAWIKNSAGWWADDTISDGEFVNALQFLLKEGIIKIEQDESIPTDSGTEIVYQTKIVSKEPHTVAVVYATENEICSPDERKKAEAYALMVEYLVKKNLRPNPTQVTAYCMELDEIKQTSYPHVLKELGINLPNLLVYVGGVEANLEAYDEKGNVWWWQCTKFEANVCLPNQIIICDECKRWGVHKPNLESVMEDGMSRLSAAIGGVNFYESFGDRWDAEAYYWASSTSVWDNQEAFDLCYEFDILEDKQCSKLYERVKVLGKTYLVMDIKYAKNNWKDDQKDVLKYITNKVGLGSEFEGFSKFTLREVIGKKSEAVLAGPSGSVDTIDTLTIEYPDDWKHEYYKYDWSIWNANSSKTFECCKIFQADNASLRVGADLWKDDTRDTGPQYPWQFQGSVAVWFLDNLHYGGETDEERFDAIEDAVRKYCANASLRIDQWECENFKLLEKSVFSTDEGRTAHSLTWKYDHVSRPGHWVTSYPWIVTTTEVKLGDDAWQVWTFWLKDVYEWSGGVIDRFNKSLTILDTTIPIPSLPATPTTIVTEDGIQYKAMRAWEDSPVWDKTNFSDIANSTIITKYDMICDTDCNISLDEHLDVGEVMTKIWNGTDLELKEYWNGKWSWNSTSNEWDEIEVDKWIYETTDLGKFQDEKLQKQIWDIYHSMTPKQIMEEIDTFLISTDDRGGGTAFVMSCIDEEEFGCGPPDSSKTKNVISFDPADFAPISGEKQAMYQPGKIKDALEVNMLKSILIHENAHVLSLSEPQSSDNDLIGWEELLVNDDWDEPDKPKTKQVFRQKAASCAPNHYVANVGCLKDDSYLNLFFQKFWADIYPEYYYWFEFADYKKHNKSNYDFHQKYYDRFVSYYAGSNTAEDFAESFMMFVLWDDETIDEHKKLCKKEGWNMIDKMGRNWKWCSKKYADNSIWEEKIRFFYDFPELVEMRDFIRSNL